MGYLKSTSNLNADRIKYGTVDGDRLPGVSETKNGSVPPTGNDKGLDRYLKDDGTWAPIEASGGGLSQAQVLIRML